jgi:uncharacterized protein (DUF1684 family)
MPDNGDYETKLLRWRDRFEENRRSPYGWLSLTGLDFLEPGDNAVGSEENCRVRLPSPNPPRVGVITLDGDRLFFTPEPGVDVRAGRAPVAEALSLPCDDESFFLESLGTRFFAMKREGKYCVRIKNPNSPARKNYPGTLWYEPKPEWLLEGRFRPSESVRTIRIPNALGGIDESPCPGVVEFEAGGRKRALAVMGHEDSGFFLVFGDATNGAETYPPGRFLNTPAPRLRKVVLDFNRAHNPPCALTPYATCPYPPEENKLDLEIPAGERYRRPG